MESVYGGTVAIGQHCVAPSQLRRRQSMSGSLDDAFRDSGTECQVEANIDVNLGNDTQGPEGEPSYLDRMLQDGD